MTFIETLPTAGSFVAVYEFNGKVWSETFLYRRGELRQWDEESQGWQEYFFRPWKSHHCKYIIPEGE